MKNMKIANKLISAFVFVSCISCILGIVGVYYLNLFKEKDEALYNASVNPLSIMTKIVTEFERTRSDLRNMIIVTDPKEIDKFDASIKQRRTAISSYSTELESAAGSQEAKDMLKAFVESRKPFNTYVDQVIALCKEGKKEEAFNLIKSDGMGKASQAEQGLIEQQIAFYKTSAENKMNENLNASKNATTIMIIVIVCGMSVSILLGFYLSKNISKPIKKLSGAAERIADGDFNVFVETGAKDETGELAESFKKMKDNLNRVLLDIDSAAEQVSSGARHVSDSSVALSQGATEQASSIQQLTASIEEISSQTKLNAQNANQANELSETAKVNAAQGKDQMTSMIKAMEEINDSSNNISRIIKVIDDIAFQTNILSLNAAVEAARAGQYGRGFAVVAEEVRNLAARSAGAAKETTNMIEGSITKVKAGTKIANDTSTALNKIVIDVDKVANLVKDIATASNEQSQGIQQINQGIMQVSQVVQTNSATSEESAAASEELSSQAELLKSRVATFKLRREKGHAKNSHHEEPSIEPNSHESNKNNDEKAGGKKILLTESEFGKY